MKLNAKELKEKLMSDKIVFYSETNEVLLFKCEADEIHLYFKDNGNIYENVMRIFKEVNDEIVSLIFVY